VEFLTTESSSFVALDDLVEEGVREIRCVVVSAAASDHRAFEREDLFQRRDRLRGCSDYLLRIRSESQTKLQVIPCVLRILPRAQLIAPCEVMLRTSETFGLFSREQRRDRATGKENPALRWLIQRARSGRED